MCICVVCTYVWITLWAPNWHIRVGGTRPPPSPPTLGCGYLVMSILSQKKRKEWANSLSSKPMPLPGPGPSWQLMSPVFRQRAGEIWLFLLSLLIGKKEWSFQNWLWCLGVLQFPSLCDQKITAQKGERKENLYFWQALRQSWIIYLFCNSFLSNILFLSLVIKNWNASFSVDALALTICLTLDKLFNISEPVYLSVITVPDTK